ncbi:hypothetical protein Hanom_Chr16g01443701 [Helianthus anomalus]
MGRLNLSAKMSCRNSSLCSSVTHPAHVVTSTKQYSLITRARGLTITLSQQNLLWSVL